RFLSWINHWLLKTNLCIIQKRLSSVGIKQYKQKIPNAALGTDCRRCYWFALFIYRHHRQSNYHLSTWRSSDVLNQHDELIKNEKKIACCCHLQNTFISLVSYHCVSVIICLPHCDHLV